MCLYRPVTEWAMRSVLSVETPRGSALRWPWQLRGNEHRNWCLSPSSPREAAMTESLVAPVRTWLAAPMEHDVSEAMERLRRAPDVQQIAVMPDVHLASDVCIGIAVASSNSIYPQAVG